VTPPVALPLYGATPHCNDRGLTDLGEHTIRGMAERRMLFDPDHMSVGARQKALDLIESMRYPGVVSSHSWATPDAYPRIYRLGGFITPYAGDSTGFVDKWRKHLTWADPRYYFGFGYGADMNGLGAQGDPRGADAPNPVSYPFRGLGGVQVHKQRSGTRLYDVNRDGVAHYGLYPDWLQDLVGLGAACHVPDDVVPGELALFPSTARHWVTATMCSRNGYLAGTCQEGTAPLSRRVTVSAHLWVAATARWTGTPASVG
jgi:hypothetical protein